MPETAIDVTTREISAVRGELRRFQNQQSDAAVQFHCIAIDTNLAAALDGQNDASFLEILASNVECLAEAIGTQRLRKTPTW
jgi:hypothetical protein